MSETYLVGLMGFPGAGKSTVAKLLRSDYGFTWISPDHLRKNMYGITDYPAWVSTIEGKEIDGDVWEYVHDLKEKELKAGRSVVFDACNLDRKSREYLFEEGIVAKCYLLYLRVNEEQITGRNIRKGRRNDVVAEWSRKLEIPTPDEQEELDYRLIGQDNNHEKDLGLLSMRLQEILGPPRRSLSTLSLSYKNR
jgi:predicted kinase